MPKEDKYIVTIDNLHGSETICALSPKREPGTLKEAQNFLVAKSIAVPDRIYHLYKLEEISC